LILELAFIGILQITSYRSVELQTDSTPFVTSTGEHVHKNGVAVSRDLLCPRAYGRTKRHRRVDCTHKHRLHYGDWVYVNGYGIKVVNDVMHERHSQAIDMWVSSHAEEKRVQVRKGDVWLIDDSPKQRTK
jgi:hypothetical protein